MTTIITTTQQSSLEKEIYEFLICQDGMGLGEMGECQDTAEAIVKNWIEKNQIVVIEQ